MAPKWPKIDSQIKLDMTTKHAMHLKTYYKSVKNHYNKYKQTTVNSETLLDFVNSTQKLCLNILEL
jgi:hypothetical protein